MDREKVIKALEDFNKNRICLPHLIPWDEIADAIELLKEQEKENSRIANESYSACWNCNHCHDGGALSGWFCDIHGDLNKCNRLVYRCKAWTERLEYQVDANGVT